MDLRRRLTAYIALLSVALVVLALTVTAVSLYRDVGNEVEASTRLTELMLVVGGARQQSGESLRRELEAAGRLRHVSLSIEEAGQPVATAPGFLDALFAGRIGAATTQRIRVGNATLAIRPDPSAEVDEIVGDAAMLLATLLVFSLGTIAIVWLAAHRALHPVRLLEDSLARLARGEARPALPTFELREFARIAIAIERLSTSLAESRSHEKRLAQRLLALQESERRELARELHDEFGQSLTAIGVGAAFVERHAGNVASAAVVECARDIRREVARISEHVRSLLAQLRPHGIETLGILDALRDLFGGWRLRASEIVASGEFPDVLPPLSPVARLALYRTLQEALTNVLRHSGAGRVRVALTTSSREVSLLVEDDGRGRAEVVQGMSGGGIDGMAERAAMAGGALKLSDAVGSGLRLELTVPVLRPGVYVANTDHDSSAAA